MKPALKFRLMLAAALLAAMLTGCVAVVAGAAGAGTVAWVRGELEATLDANYEKAATAANLAIKQLQFAKISEKKDALTAILIARTAEDKKVEIKVIKVGDQSAKVQIRVGVFGDEALSLTILDKIKTNL
jgi:ABC-type glycerol-3-phosphate transport system substrate-binding protein